MNTNNPFSEWMDNHIKEISGGAEVPKEPIVRYRVKEVDMLLELEERRHEEIMGKLLSLKQLVK